MSQEYLERLATLMREATSVRFKDIKLEHKHFFSGAALYANGKICLSLTPVGFAIKLPEESRNSLLEQKGTKPLRYFPKGPIKKEYVVLPKHIVENKRRFKKLLDKSIQYATRRKNV